MDLSLTTRPEGEHTVVRVGGEIDVYTAPQLREQFLDLIRDGRYHLVVNLDDVGFLDSYGVSALVNGLKRVRVHNGTLRLVCTQERLLMVFLRTGLMTVFPIHDSDAEALAEARAEALAAAERP